MEFLILLAALPVLFWMALAVQRLPVLDWCLVFLLADSCLGANLLKIGLPGLPLTLDRVAIVLVVIAYILQRRAGRVDPKPWTRADLAPLLLVGTLLVSAIYGMVLGAPSLRNETCFRLLVAYIVPLTVYAIARQSLLTEKAVDRVHVAFALFGLYLVATGFFETFGLRALVFPTYINDPDVGLHYGRARGPFVQAVTNGLALAACGLAMWITSQRYGRGPRLAWMAAIGCTLGAIFFTYTRSVWIGTFLAAMVLMAFQLKGVWRPLALVGLVAGALLVGATQYERILRIQRDNSAAESQESVELRPSFAYVSWQMFLDRPLMGVGFGQFPLAKLPYLDDHNTSLHLQSIRRYVHHNTYLSLLAESGAIGLGSFLLLLAIWARGAIVAIRDRSTPAYMVRHQLVFLGLLAVYSVQLAFHELSYSTVDHALIFFCAGMSRGLIAARGSHAVPVASRALAATLPTRWPSAAAVAAAH